jgi:hypothetical protein
VRALIIVSPACFAYFVGPVLCILHCLSCAFCRACPEPVEGLPACPDVLVSSLAVDSFNVKALIILFKMLDQGQLKLYSNLIAGFTCIFFSSQVPQEHLVKTPAWLLGNGNQKIV